MPNSITAVPLKYPPIQSTTAPEPLSPSTREQELEAQNKALWELVGECERLFRLISSTIYNDNGDIGMEPITACSAAESGLAAIQKAKESKA